MFGVWPSGEIGPALADKFQRQRRTQAMNLRQVDAENRVQCGPRIEGWRIGRFCLDDEPAAAGPLVWLRRLEDVAGHSIRKSHSTTLV